MKKYIFIFIITFVLICVVGFISKFYYPELPFEGATKQKVVSLLKKSDGELIQLAANEDYYWFGIESNQEVGREKVITFLEDKGLKFVDYMGSGIIFSRDKSGTLVVSSQMWTRKYVLYQVPAEVMDIPVIDASGELQPDIVKVDQTEKPEFSKMLTELN